MKKNISLIHCAWWKFKIFDGTQSWYFFFLSLFFLIVGPTWTGKSGFSFCLHIKFNVLGYVYYFGITKQIIYCVKGDILKMFIYNFYIQLYFMAVLIVKYLFLLNQNTRCLWATHTFRITKRLNNLRFN